MITRTITSIIPIFIISITIIIIIIIIIWASTIVSRECNSLKFKC